MRSENLSIYLIIHVFLFIKADRLFVFTIHANVLMVYFGYFPKETNLEKEIPYFGIGIPVFFLKQVYSK